MTWELLVGWIVGSGVGAILAQWRSNRIMDKIYGPDGERRRAVLAAYDDHYLRARRSRATTNPPA